MTRYVQHQSGAGQMWKVRLSISVAWQCYDMATNFVYFLPKSEYVEVPAPVMPDRWVDVTEQCTVDEHDGLGDQQSIHDEGEKMVCWTEPKSCYRLRKLRLFDHGQHQDGTAFQPVEQWAFIVERKEP